MLFTTFVFMLVFLPITLMGWHVANKVVGVRYAIGFLVAASLFFYGWWNPRYLFLLVGSIAANYAFGRFVSRPNSNRALLGIGIAFNLGLLAYFKYAEFFVLTASDLTTADWNFDQVILPLAISFFTFQQIAFLVDAHRGLTTETNIVRYTLFVCFVPQLIAGPIVHHREMLPQFMRLSGDGLTPRNIAIGLTVFVLGLGKKILIADSLGSFVDPMFVAIAQGIEPSLLEAWAGILSYSFQIYFDFSGYSDMAIGLGFMFGIRLPLNFDSPYKSTSVIDFWGRWHITLSRFLRQYLYFPLGGNRKGPTRRYVNLMIVMLLGGLWHGAGWSFVFWGGLHGTYLVVNHLWVGGGRGRVLPGAPFTSWMLTFLAVTIAWTFFRADNLQAAWSLLLGMAGLNGVAIPEALPLISPEWTPPPPIDRRGLQFLARNQVTLLVLATFTALALPNVQQLFTEYRPTTEAVSQFRRTAISRLLMWTPSAKWVIGTTAVALAALIQIFLRVEPVEFLYFQF